MRSISEMVLRDDSEGSPVIAFAFQLALLFVTVWQCLRWYIYRVKSSGANGSLTGIWASFLIAVASSVATAVLTITKEPTGHVVSASLMFLSYWLCLSFLTRYLYKANPHTPVWTASALLFLAFACAATFVASGIAAFEYATALLLLGVLWALADAGEPDCFKVLPPVIVRVHLPLGLRL